MSAFPVICGVILILFIGIFLNKANKKEEVKPEIVIPKERPVIIELIPKGTSNNPFVCKVGSEVALEVKGFSDYKKENEVKLNGDYCSWHKSCPCGSFAKEYGVTNIYYTPSVAGLRDIWVRFNDNKLKTSAALKIMVKE